MTYQEFLASKRQLATACGFAVPASAISAKLFPFQRDVALLNLERGKSANFMNTGLGKGPVQMEVCSHISERAKGNTLIGAPLAVAQQFMREARKFDHDLTLCQSQSDVRPGVNVTNYERLKLFDLSKFVGISLDESSCIKDWTSRTARELITRTASIPYKLCSTATPSPNDHAELGTHSELLDVLTRTQMLAMFFEHDGGDTAKWTLKHHGKKPFFRYVVSWATCVNKPSDLGYSDTGFDLPKLHIHEHIVPVDQSVNTNGMLYRCPDLGATGLHKEMRLTADDRARCAAEIVRAKPQEQWLVWCNTDYEADAMKRVLPECFEVRGSHSTQRKEQAAEEFVCGGIKWLLSKPEIYGLGLNLQNCANMVFMGLNYSFELLYQAIRRCWRFGQAREVNAHLVIAETEGAVLSAVRRKQRQFAELQDEMIAMTRSEQLAARHKATRYNHSVPMEIPTWLQTQ